jgi:hypothetical protein
MQALPGPIAAQFMISSSGRNRGAFKKEEKTGKGQNHYTGKADKHQPEA